MGVAEVNLKSDWSTVLFWGGLSGLCYVTLFYYADEFIQLAHTTVDACVVVEEDKTSYFHKPDAEACAAKGGRMTEGNGWHVFAPIGVALIISYTHGLFTGHFWEALGLTAAKKK